MARSSGTTRSRTNRKTVRTVRKLTEPSMSGFKNLSRSKPRKKTSVGKTTQATKSGRRYARKSLPRRK